jgi:hypothetical protein
MPKAKTAAVSAPKSAPAVDALDATHAMRVALRKAIIATEDTSTMLPVDLELVRPLVREHYLPIFEMAVDSGEECVVEIDLCQGTETGAGVSVEAYDFIANWVKANGKNRTPVESHYSHLASEFRSEWVPSASHWVLTTESLVANGGHSGRGVALAFFPPSVEFGCVGTVLELNDLPVDPESDQGQLHLDDVSGRYFIGEKPKLDVSEESVKVVFESQPLANPDFQRVGCDFDANKGNTPYPCVDEEGTFGVRWDIPNDYTPPESLVIRLTLNAPPKACLKMDDKRLQASMMDFLEMVPSIKEFLKSIHPTAKKVLPETLLNLYKRLDHTSEGFGILAKGGRPNKADVQFWFLAFWPLIADCLKVLTRNGERKELASPPFLTVQDPKQQKGGIKLYHILVAMAVSTPEGRKRIAEVSGETDKNKWTKEQLAWRDNVIATSGSAQPANADQIVESLVLYGMSKDPLLAFEATDQPGRSEGSFLQIWQTMEGRVSDRWDSKLTDSKSPQSPEAGEDYRDTLAACAKMVSDLIGDSAAAESAARKALPSRAKKALNGRAKK